jgi:hypothetical protein
MSQVRISKGQLRRLLTLWGLLAAKQGFDSKNRDLRLVWAGGILERQIASYKDITREEAKTVIDRIQECLPPEVVRRRRPDRRQARAYGTAGRKSVHRRTGKIGLTVQRFSGLLANEPVGQSTNQPTVDMVDPPTLELLATLKAKLGWDQARFEAFLRSPSSPIPGRDQIDTMGQANAVIWALKALLRKRRIGPSVERLNGQSTDQPINPSAKLRVALRDSKGNQSVKP